MTIWEWLGFGSNAPGAEFDSLIEIEQALVGLDRTRARYAACFAYILTRSARADHQVSDVETGQMEGLVSAHTGLSLDQAAVAVRLAAAQARRSGGTDDFVITREFDRLATHEQKVALVDCLFGVSSVDASIVTVEDNEIRRIANELKIEHPEYIAVRSRHLENLEVLRRRRT